MGVPNEFSKIGRRKTTPLCTCHPFKIWTFEIFLSCKILFALRPIFPYSYQLFRIANYITGKTSWEDQYGHKIYVPISYKCFFRRVFKNQPVLLSENIPKIQNETARPKFNSILLPPHAFATRGGFPMENESQIS